MQIDDTNYEKIIGEVEPFLFLFFGATFCGPTQFMRDFIEDARYEFGDAIVVVEVDVEECPRLTRAMEVKNTPTVVCLKRGEPLASKMGTSTMDQFLDWIEGCMKKADPKPAGGKKKK